MLNKRELKLRRARRTRYRLRLSRRLRLSVFFSHRHVHAQVINDQEGRTLVAASTLDSSLRDKVSSHCCKDLAKLVGELVAERAVAKDIKEVVLDRGDRRYGGVLASFADAAREKGLSF